MERNRKIRFGLIAFIFLSSAIPGSCADDKNTKALIVALRNDMPLLSFLNVDGQPAGMFPDIWKLWEKKTGRKIAFYASEWNETITSLRNGDADIHGTLAYTEERARWMSYSQHFYEVSLCVFFRKKTGRFRTISDLKGEKTGVIGGTITEQELRRDYPDIEIVGFSTVKDQVHAAMDGKIRAFVSPPSSVSEILRSLGLVGEFDSTDETLYPTKLYASVLKENKNLLGVVDRGFDAISNEELAEIESRWIPDSAKRYYRNVRAIRLTKKEEAWLKTNKTVRVGIPEAFPPVMNGEDNRFRGMIPDYLDLIGDRTGLRFEMVSANLSELPERIRTRQTDMFPAFLDLRPDHHIRLTAPCFPVAWVIVNRTNDPVVRNVKDLAGMRVAVVDKTPLWERIRKDSPKINLDTVATSFDGLRSVASGKTGAFIGALPVVGHIIRKHHFANLKIAGSAGYEDFLLRFAVRSDLPELTGILNKTIQSVSRQEHDEIFKQNTPVRFEYAADWRAVAKWTLGLSGIFIAIAGISLLWNRRLAKEIEDRKRADKALMESQKSLSMAQEVAQIGSWEYRVKTGGLYWSDELYRIHGLDPEAASASLNHGIGMIHPADRKRAEEAFEKAMKNGLPYEIEYRIVRPDGEERFLRAIGNILRNQNGEVSSVYGTGQDITRRKRAEEALKKSEKRLREYSERLEEMVAERTRELERVQKELLLKERLAMLGHISGSISHEIRNPLATIDSSIYFLTMKLQDPGEKIRRHLERITGNVRKATAIIESLLNLTRMEKPKTETVRLNDFIPGVLASAGIPETIETATQYSETEVFVDVDSEQMRMALNNIIKNAVQAMENRGALTVSVRSPGNGMAELAVADTGPGIRPEHMGKIFEPLFTTKAEGIGFGLSITKMIVENHGGTVGMRSDPGGTTFVLRLPRSKKETFI